MRITSSLLDCLKNLPTYKHHVAYYGPSSQEDVLAIVEKEHKMADTLADLPERSLKMEQTPENTVYIAPYDAKQIYMVQYSNDGKMFDESIENARQLYNEYFNGGMNSIVFQEMRESRSLAYTASAALSQPGIKDRDNYGYITFIATQNDKMLDATKAFNDIINNMPVSEPAFKLAKDGFITRLRTDRVIKSDVIWFYLDAQDLGRTTDYRISLYDYLQNATLQDVIDFQQKYVKGRTYRYAILGDKSQLDMKGLRKIGPVVELTTKEIFGY